MTFDYFYPDQAEQFAFFRIPKVLFRDQRFKPISTDAKVLYGLMLDRVSLSVKNKWIDSKGRVYIIFTLDEIMEELDCANQKATKLLVELEEKAYLIERKRQGLGKPTLIYVKNFASEIVDDESHILNHDFHDLQNHGFHESGLMIDGNPDSWESHAINTDNINTDLNNTDLFISSGEDKHETEWNETESRSEIKDLFEKNLQAEALREGRPKDAGLVNEIIELLVDTYCSRQKRIRIARDDKPADDVRKQLLKLDAEHIEFVLSCMAQNNTQIMNIRQYLLASLYNAPMTIENYYSALVQHDIATGKL